jgi:hypothetical protein
MKNCYTTLLGRTLGAGVLCLAAVLLTSTGSAVAAGANDAPARPSAVPSLKSAPADKDRIEPLRAAFLDFDQHAAENRGAPPSNARQRIAEMRRLTGPAKQAIRELVNRLDSAGETAAFDALVERKVKELNAPPVLAELQQLGGAAALLRGADRAIDEMIAHRSTIAEQRAEALILELLGIGSAHASLKSGTCALFWYTISFGYGTAHDYRSCYY